MSSAGSTTAHSWESREATMYDAHPQSSFRICLKYMATRYGDLEVPSIAGSASPFWSTLLMVCAGIQPRDGHRARCRKETAVPFYEKGDVRIRYEMVGSGFPLLVTPGGG